MLLHSLALTIINITTHLFCTTFVDYPHLLNHGWNYIVLKYHCFCDWGFSLSYKNKLCDCVGTKNRSCSSTIVTSLPLCMYLCQGFINLTQLNTAQLSACCLLLQSAQIPLFPDLAPNHVVLPVLQFLLEQDSYWIFTARKRRWGKVMFSFVSLSGCSQEGSTCDLYPCSIALILTPNPRHQTWPSPAMGNILDIIHVTPLALLHTTDIWWPSLETFSNLSTWGLPRWYWHLVAFEARTVCKRVVRNAFLHYVFCCLQMRFFSFTPAQTWTLISTN